MNREEKAKIRVAAQEIIMSHIQNAHDFLNEYCEGREIAYGPELQEAVRKEAARLARAMRFAYVPGILERREAR